MVLSFGMALVLVLILTRARQRRLEIQADVQAKLIEKFGSTADLVTFLQSEAGRSFVSGVQRGYTTVLRDRIVTGYQRAIVCSVLGLAFMVMMMITRTEGLAWPGVILLAIGVAFFGATYATARLSEPPQRHDTATEITPRM